MLINPATSLIGAGLTNKTGFASETRAVINVHQLMSAGTDLVVRRNAVRFRARPMLFPGAESSHESWYPANPRTTYVGFFACLR